MADDASRLQETRKMAEAGDARAQFNLGIMHLAGTHGCRRSIPDALQFFSEASKQGHGLALSNLGTMHDQGLGVLASADEAKQLWTKAAKRGVPQAQFNLGLYAETGRGGEVDFEAAHRWYDAAASSGHAAAIANLGALFDDGRGVNEDPDRAGRLYELAAAKGHSSAAFNLACLHREGRITPPGQKSALDPVLVANRDGTDDHVGEASLVPATSASYNAETEARRWLEQARELGLGKWGVRRRLLGRWSRRWAVWIALVVSNTALWALVYTIHNFYLSCSCFSSYSLAVFTFEHRCILSLCLVPRYLSQHLVLSAGGQVGLALEHTALTITLGVRLSAFFAVVALLVGVCIAAVASARSAYLKRANRRSNRPSVR